MKERNDIGVIGFQDGPAFHCDCQSAGDAADLGAAVAGVAWRDAGWPLAATLDGRMRMAARSWFMLALLLFVQIASIANLRFFSEEGINPLGAELGGKIEVFGRILQNTLVCVAVGLAF